MVHQFQIESYIEISCGHRVVLCSKKHTIESFKNLDDVLPYVFDDPY